MLISIITKSGNLPLSYIILNIIRKLEEKFPNSKALKIINNVENKFYRV